MTVQRSSEDKVLFPESGVTKGEVIDYYEAMADVLMPHLAGRPISMKRCPDGIEDCFFQKHPSDYFPASLERCEVDSDDGTTEQFLIDSTDDLVWLANQGMIEIHVPPATTGGLHRPDQLVFDLDPPPEADFDVVRQAARDVRARLAEASLQALLKTSGSSGLHVVVPIEPAHDFDDVRDWARRLAEDLAEAEPARYTTEIRKNKRKGRLFLDINRNAYAQTAVAPYSVRAIEGAPVATPIDWDELATLDSAQHYRLANIRRRLGQKADPWQDMARQRQKLPI